MLTFVILSALGFASCFSVTFGIPRFIGLPRLSQNRDVIVFRSNRPHLRTAVSCVLCPVEWQTVTVVLNDLQGHAAQQQCSWTALSMQ